MDTEYEGLKRQLNIHRDNLNYLEEQAAMRGAGNTPLDLWNQIQAEKREIARLEEELSTRGYSSGEKIDHTIRAKRIVVYEELWRRLKLLARYDREKQLTPAVIREISQAMMQWYFEVGGLYLSDESRVPYFELKEALRMIFEEGNYQPDEVVRVEDQEVLIQKASRLRASLRRDIGT